MAYVCAIGFSGHSYQTANQNQTSLSLSLSLAAFNGFLARFRHRYPRVFPSDHFLDFTCFKGSVSLCPADFSRSGIQRFESFPEEFGDSVSESWYESRIPIRSWWKNRLRGSGHHCRPRRRYTTQLFYF